MGISKTQHKKLMALGERLKAIRNEKCLTLKELGYKIDKDPQSISRVEMGDVNPTYLYLLELCEGLEINITEVLTSLPK
jgi:putative transcriptional regulator